MPMLELTEDQVVELVKQLPPERRRATLLALATSSAEQAQKDSGRRKSNCGAYVRRGLDWEKMTEDERETFIDGLIHEDRPCGP